jgi:hypothetical protein
MYETEDGKVPVSDWLDALRAQDKTTYDRIINFIDRVENGSESNFRPEVKESPLLKWILVPDIGST